MFFSVLLETATIHTDDYYIFVEVCPGGGAVPLRQRLVWKDEYSENQCSGGRG